ncbi:MAG: hypothetical protein ALECFALPRED_004766 [Alectoria fallacina]|uniref:Uncharacterized protein n=1 Tax=Alectoria fallacina TaxID=1903189 RepID=A0A8H3FUG5_9LECA|nr:MAG: hypothetical protein ALECFALPRED_004766 [Alectoria fallacina]
MERKRAVLTTRKFALPRPPRDGIERAVEIAKSLNIPPDPPTPSPRTALVRKRHFERFSDSESEDERGGKRRVDRPVAGEGGGKGEGGVGDGDEGGARALDSWFEGLGGKEEEEEEHLYSDDSGR